jgi:hypothetical protein
MVQNEHFLNVADRLKPTLIEKNVMPLDMELHRQRLLSKGDILRLDFGNHFVGKVTLKFGFTGSHPDAPAWIRLKFAERECELSENAETYRGWISMGWIQQEQLHIDVLPSSIALPRRYAFRYLQIEVLDVSSKYQLKLEDALCVATTSADDAKLHPYLGTERQVRLDQIACHTLRECMQDVFEDGPKRDRRLWMGDLRMQALANYETFRNYDLVKRCLYLFAGTMMDGGRIGACLFTEPKIEVDDTVMFDYSLFYIPTLLDYYKATGDMETLRELAPTALHQLEVVRPYFGENHLVKDSNMLGWCFVDWNLGLNKQASAQGIYLYCLKAAIEMAGLLGVNTQTLQEDFSAKKAAAELLWNGSFYVSGENQQVSWASQVWMTLGGATNGDAQLLERLEQTSAEAMVTPYMYHNYIDALLTVGQKEKALQVMDAYWGGMMDDGADTFWELYNPQNPDESPYGGTIVNSYCHAWSCAPAYFLRKFFSKESQ